MKLRGRPSGREFWLVAVPSALLILVVLYAALRVADPLPPRRLTIGTAMPGSGYALFAERYRERLAREGVDLEIRHSGGSAENLARLRATDSGIDAAFTTVGAAQPGDDARLASLGGVFPSPVFVFYRGEETITRFSQFRGKRVSVGTTGTYLRGAMQRVLQASGATEGTSYSDLPPDQALQALLAGELDAMMIPSSLDNPLVRAALRAPGVRLMNVAQADAIAKRVPELRRVVLPRGAIDLAQDEPREDIHLLASTNSLVVRRALHPALQLLLLETAKEVHSVPGVFQRFGEYPAAQAQDLPLSDAAERYYQGGRPLLYRHLGFRAAALADRLMLIMIPVIAMLIPVLGYAPPLYRWLNRRRIWRWHHELLEIESAAAAGHDRDALLGRLREAESAIARIKVAGPFLDELYHLRNHLADARDKVRSASGQP